MTTNIDSTPHNSSLAALEKMIASTCFCKLRTKCEDKNNPECLKYRNLYAEAMLAHKSAR